MNTIQIAVDTLVSSFLSHDRIGDEELPPGLIEQMIKQDELAIEDLLEYFRDSLIDNLI